MATVNAKRLIVVCVLLGTAAACSAPTPRSYADQGVAYQPDRAGLNAPYYIGADPSHQRQRSGGGP
jgi:hypothetical protein